MDEDWIVFQVGSLLTAGQLNEFETWQLYIDQELSDLVTNLTAPDINLADTDDLPGDNITITPTPGLSLTSAGPAI